MKGLAGAPTVVAAFFDDVDFFENILADVPGPEFAGLAIEAHAPGVAHAVGENLLAGDIGLQVGGGGFEIGLFGRVDKWIVLRDAVWQAGGARIHIDADDFAENIVELLSGIVRVVAV